MYVALPGKVYFYTTLDSKIKEWCKS